MVVRRKRALRPASWLLTLVAATATAQEPLQEASIHLLDRFQGSPAARQALLEHGFVVVPGMFRELYQAYLASPVSLFVTSDAVLDVYSRVFQGVMAAVEEHWQGLLFEASAHAAIAIERSCLPGTERRELSAWLAAGAARIDPARWEALVAEGSFLQRLPRRSQPQAFLVAIDCRRRNPASAGIREDSRLAQQARAPEPTATPPSPFEPRAWRSAARLRAAVRHARGRRGVFAATGDPEHVRAANGTAVQATCRESLLHVEQRALDGAPARGADAPRDSVIGRAEDGPPDHGTHSAE